jgi:hypothetical protein
MERPGEHLRADDLSEYLDGRTAEGDRGRIREHLHACAVCAAELAELRRTVDLLRQLPDLTPPRNFTLGPRREQAPSVAARVYPWTRVLSAIAAAFFVIMLVLDVSAPHGDAPSAKLGLASPTLTEASPTATAAPQNVAAVPTANPDRPTPEAAASPSPGHVVLSAQDVTSGPLPTLTPTPQKQQPTLVPTVVRVEERVGAPDASQQRWLWEAVALVLAVALAAATLVLRRQARADGAY